MIPSTLLLPDSSSLFTHPLSPSWLSIGRGSTRPAAPLIAPVVPSLRFETCEHLYYSIVAEYCRLTFWKLSSSVPTCRIVLLSRAFWRSPMSPAALKRLTRFHSDVYQLLKGSTSSQKKYRYVRHILKPTAETSPAASQILTVQSSNADASQAESGEKATEWM